MSRLEDQVRAYTEHGVIPIKWADPDPLPKIPSPRRVVTPALRFTAQDSAHAWHTWGANCGPHSLAAACGKSLEEIRQICFPSGFRGYMTPTMMNAALTALQGFSAVNRGGRTRTFRDGIFRVQWEGKWLNPGVPAREAYRHTHYIAVCGDHVLCTVIAPSAWISTLEWEHYNQQRRAEWHFSHLWVSSRFFQPT